MSNDHLSRHRDSGRVVTEMTKRIEYKGKYAVRPLVKEEKGFYKEAEKEKIKPPKNYGMMAAKVMIPSVDEQGMWA